MPARYGGLSKRKLWTDGGEHIVDVCRPVLLNGIPSLLARGDLADRALSFTVPPITDENRRTEAQIEREFQKAAPAILGLFLDGLSSALQRMPTLKLPKLPRMADFALLACAAAPAFGWTADEILEALRVNAQATISTVIDADPRAGEIIEIAKKGNWQGSATDLLVKVNGSVPDEVKKDRSWPKDGARLSARLKRLATALRRSGVDVKLLTSGGRAGRIIEIQAGITTRSMEKQRSEGSERSNPPNPSNSGTLRNADPPFGNGEQSVTPERSGTLGNGEQKFTVPGNVNDISELEARERWIAGNAVFPTSYLKGGGICAIPERSLASEAVF